MKWKVISLVHHGAAWYDWRQSLMVGGPHYRDTKVEEG